MTDVLTRRAVMMAAVLATATALAGCGKRGPLEPAEGMNPDKSKQQGEPADGTIPGMKGARRRPPPIKPPERDLFLDFLL